MTKSLNRASTDELALLADPKSLQLLRLLSKNGWLALDVKELNQFFGPDEHQARDALLAEARTGGKYGTHQISLVLIFLAFSIFVTSFMSLKDPVIFTMWGALGVAIGLLIARYPAALDRLRKNKQ